MSLEQQARAEFAAVVESCEGWYHNTTQWGEASWVEGKSVWDIWNEGLDALITAVRLDQQEQARAPRFNDPDEKFAFDNGSGSTEVMTTAEMIAEIQRLGLRCVELHTQSEQARAEIERLDKENRQMNQTLATTALDVFHAVERAELAESQLTEARATTAQLEGSVLKNANTAIVNLKRAESAEARLREQGKA